MQKDLFKLCTTKERLSMTIWLCLAYENLNSVKKYASRFNGVDEPTKAHRKYLIYIIEKALKV